MIFQRSGKKRIRHGTAAHREFRETEAPRIFKWGAEALSLTAAFVILTAFVTEPPKFPRKAIGYDIDSQSVALEEIRSDIYFQAEDLQATRMKRDEAAAKVPDTFRVDREQVKERLRLLDDRIEELNLKREQVAEVVRKALRGSNSSQTDSDVVAKAATDYAAHLMDEDAFRNFGNPSDLAVWLMPTVDSIPKRQFVDAGKKNGNGDGALRVAGLIEPEGKVFEFAYAKDLAKLAREGLEYVLTYGVISRERAAAGDKKAITIIRELPVDDHKPAEELPIAKVPTPEEAQAILRDRIAEAARAAAGRESDSPVDWTRLQAAAADMAKQDITQTLFSDQVDTERARERARLAVNPVLKEIRPGKVLQRSGDDWTAQSRSDVRTYWAELEGQREPVSRILAAIGANMILVLLALACLVRSIRFLTAKPQDVLRNLNLAVLVMVATVVLGRIASYFEPSGLVVPTAAGAILVTILLNPRIAVMTAFMTSALVSIQFGYDWRALILGCTMSAAGVFSTYEVRRRSDMTSAAAKATIAGILVIAALSLGTETPTGSAALRRIALVALNGGMCMLIVPGLLSPLERLFRITTDIQLLEYSDLNNKLLSRMAIEMPATYAHALMLGQIAEAAAEAIGANGLLARVCAYYHDIGKMRRPEYFSENQTGFNVHDDMPPRLSARAIAAHVAYGVELAKEYHLPDPIIGGIREHHGTCMIGFFYQQAVEQHRHHDVQEEDFRYPGPKPQSRETAILMICDAIESGVRSIRNPNEERVREFVDKIVAARANDHQFDECGLTLKDLGTIKEVVAHRVATSLHARIAYPEKKPEKRPDNVIPMSGKAQ